MLLELVAGGVPYRQVHLLCAVNDHGETLEKAVVAGLHFVNHQVER